MNHKGYTLWEMMLSLAIATVVFVILTKILYNYTTPQPDPIDSLNFEAFIAKVESDLWYVEPDDITIRDDQLIYVRNRTRYVFYHEDEKLMVAIGQVGKESPYVWMEGVSELQFTKDSYGIKVTWRDSIGTVDEQTIFYPRF